MKQYKPLRYHRKIGERFKKLRESLDTAEKDCTQDMLSKEIGIKKPQISELENGRRLPSINELRAYHKRFRVPMEYLLGIFDNAKYENIQIGQELGLSDAAIEQIKNVKQKSEEYNSNSKTSPIRILNELLTYKNGAFLIFLYKIEEYLRYNMLDTSRFYDVVGIEKCEARFYERNITEDDESEVILFKLQQIFISMIKDIKESHKPKKDGHNGKYSTKEK